jgi:hypothetical protein
MPVRVWREVIVPLLGRESCVIVGISTPVDSFNFFSKLIKKRNPVTGQPLFLLAIVELACKRCIEREQQHRCRHNLKFLPPWKTKQKQAVMQMMLDDQKTTFDRENLGIQTDEGNSYISKEYIDRWLAQPRYVPAAMERVDTVLICVDLNGSDSKNASEMAIATVVMRWNLIMVSRTGRALLLRRLSGRAGQRSVCRGTAPRATPGRGRSPAAR